MTRDPSVGEGTTLPRLMLRPPDYTLGRRSGLAWPVPLDKVQPGTVVAIDGRSGGVLAEVLERGGRSVRQLFPSCPVTLLVDRESLRMQQLLSARLLPLGLRGVLLEDLDLGPQLRVALTGELALASEVVSWFGLVVRRFDRAEKLVSVAIEQGVSRHSVAELARRAGLSRRTAGFRLAACGLPPLRSIRQLSVGLLAVARLQREPGDPASRIARSLGFADPSSLSHLLASAFGIHCAEARSCLGWEWVLFRWMHRHGLSLGKGSAVRGRSSRRMTG